jgi:hypothetical protein
VIFVSGSLNGLFALVGLVLTGLSFWMYRGAGNVLWLVLMILFLLATLAFGGMFLSGRVNRGDDIHITE